MDYDLLLEHPDGGTVALSWRPDDETPWSVVYADHWAANYVVSVNNYGVTVQEALLFLKLAGGQYPDLMTEFVDQTLIAQAIDENLASVSEAELQMAADEFRSANGLYGSEATFRWLKEVGLSEPRFRDLLSRLVRRQKLEEQVTKDQMQPYFQTHRESYNTVRFFRVQTQKEAVAKRVAASARKEGLLLATNTRLSTTEDKYLTGSLESAFAIDLPPKLASAPMGKVIGPIVEGRTFWIAQVLQRMPARLDTPTEAAIRDRLFRKWLAKRRRQANVQWHWM